MRSKPPCPARTTTTAIGWTWPKCFESGDWAKLDELTRALKLDSIKVASSYCEALNWAKELYEQPAGEA